MWFNIIPPFAIIMASLGLPAYATYWIYYLANGNHFRRSLGHRWERHLYTRDVRLTGSPYIMQGLETVEDVSESEMAKRADERATSRAKRRAQIELKKKKILDQKIAQMIAE